MKTALIVIDAQNDYIKENGILYIPYSINIINVINKIQNNFDIVCFTKNEFEKTNKYITNDIKISDSGQYCIKGTDGVKLHENLITNNNIFIRNYNDSYSVTNSKNESGTLLNFLKENGITHVFVCGLPGDYSVKFSLINLNEHFKTYLIIDAIRTLGKLSVFVNFLSSNKIPFIPSKLLTLFLKNINKKNKFYKKNKEDDIYKEFVYYESKYFK